MFAQVGEVALLGRRDVVIRRWMEGCSYRLFRLDMNFGS